MVDARQATDAGAIVDAERGERLKHARERAGIAQQDAASSLGITRGTLRRWERGHWMPEGAFAALAGLYSVEEHALRDGAPSPLYGTVRPMSAVVRERPEPPEWPQWIRERWAEVHLELVRAGATDEELVFLRGLVLAPIVARHLDALDDAALARAIDAGIVAARAWFHTCHPAPTAQAAS